jgi:tetratricopeptide (TPR) repeat protein/DNA-binding CsgD family transcriptional regulator
MNLDLFSFFAGSRIRWVFLWLVGFGFHLQAQPKTQVDILRKQFGWPTFDSILKLNPAQRCLFLENTRVKSTTDKSAFRQLNAAFRQYAENKDDRDALLLADLFDYYNHTIELNFHVHSRRHIAFLENLHLKAGRNGVRWYSEEVDLLLAKAYLADIRNYESGLFLLRELVAGPEAGKGSDSPQRQNILMALGLAYFSFNDQQNALYYFRKALNTKVPTEMRSDRSVVFLLNNLGLCFRDLRQLDSSDYYFRKELMFTRIKQDSIYEHITLGNLGENQYLRGNYDEAIPLLFSDAEMANKVSDFSLASNALILMGDIYVRKGQYQKADSLLTEGLRLTRITQSYRRKKKVFPIMARFYLHTGRPDLAALFLDSSHFVADSLVRLNNQSKISAAEANFAYQSLKIASVQQRSELELSNQRRNAGILILVLLMIIGILFFLRNRASARAREAELRLLHQQTEQELLSAREQLDVFVTKLTEAPLESVEWLNSSLNTGLQQHQFMELFSQSFPGYTQRLKEAYPGLTETEIRFCCLERLKLSTKEKAVILGINENSVHKTQSRLRTKMGLSKEESLSIRLSDI